MALRGLGELTAAGRSSSGAEGGGYPVPTRSASAVARTRRPRVDASSLARVAAGGAARERVQAERALNAYNYVAMIAYHQSDVPAQIFSTFAALRLAPTRRPVAAGGPALRRGGKRPRLRRTPRKLAWRYARLSHQIAQPPATALSMASSIRYSGHLAALLGEMDTFDKDIHAALDVYTRIGHTVSEKKRSPTAPTSMAFAASCRRQPETFREIERSGLHVATNRRRRGECSARPGSAD